jgi:hypothetical protein
LPFDYTVVIPKYQGTSLPFAIDGTNSLLQWKSKNDSKGYFNSLNVININRMKL